MKTYKIGVVWQMYGHVEVEADSIDDAMELVHDGPLPENASYVDGSFEVDIEPGYEVTEEN